MPEPVGTVGTLRRYPVKSLGGEQLDRVDVDARGIAGDRTWFVRDHDGKMGSGKSSTRFRRMDGLLRLAASFDGAEPRVHFADGPALGPGEELRRRLSDHVGRHVDIAPEADVSAFDDGPIHLVTSASLAALAHKHGTAVDPVRLRPNLVLDTPGLSGPVEQDWIGAEVAVGPDAVLRVEMASQRCVMVGMAQRDLPDDDRLLRTISDCFDVELGVIASVVRPGTIAVGDVVTVRHR